MLRLVVLLLAGFFASLLLMGNKNGRASQAQRGNTGAPGDETQGGQAVTCMSCHNQGPISASLAITVLDADGNSVTQYVPEQDYTARVTITATGPNLSGYGFQMIGLRDSNDSDLKGFSDMNPNNYKLASIPGGRVYAEHDNISTSNTFNVKWKAPIAGTGSVTLYAAGNGVNGNGTTSGDGASFSALKLTEMTLSANSTLDAELKLFVSPNPVLDLAVLNIENILSGDHRLLVFDANGKKVWERQQNLLSGEVASFVLPAVSWQPGVYFVRLEHAGKAATVKVLKL